MKKILLFACTLLLWTAYFAYAEETVCSGVCSPIAINQPGEHTVILNGVTIEATESPAISVEAPAEKLTVIIKNGTENRLTGGRGFAGIANNGVTLVIRCENAGGGHECGDSCGVLMVTGGRYTSEEEGGAGIGGNNGQDMEGTVIIGGGNIFAIAQYSGAGIGGGCGGDLSGSLLITGGNVQAEGSSIMIGEGGTFMISAGIGGGCGGDLSGSVTISGGYVQAQGGNFSAGIGSSGTDKNMSGTVTVTGGCVKAWSGDWNSDGIGAGCNGSITGRVIVDPVNGKIDGDAGKMEEETQTLTGSAFISYTDVTEQVSDKGYAHFIYSAFPAPEYPQTGDAANLTLLAVTAVMGMLCTVLIVQRRNKT